jgi:hypothetical protein
VNVYVAPSAIIKHSNRLRSRQAISLHVVLVVSLVVAGMCV